MKSEILLITISGHDKPGIVRAVAETVQQRGGNWECCRLTHLAGRFVGLLQVSVPGGQAEDLRVDLLAIPGLETTVAVGARPEKAGCSWLRLSALGADSPGIVHEVFGSLAELGLNVEALDTRTEAAASSGTVLFRIEALLSSPQRVNAETVREKLETIAYDLQVEVELAEPPAGG